MKKNKIKALVSVIIALSLFFTLFPVQAAAMPADFDETEFLAYVRTELQNYSTYIDFSDYGITMTAENMKKVEFLVFDCLPDCFPVHWHICKVPFRACQNALQEFPEVFQPVDR